MEAAAGKTLRKENIMSRLALYFKFVNRFDMHL